MQIRLVKIFLLATLIVLKIPAAPAQPWQGVPKILRISDAVSADKTFSVNGFGFTDDAFLDILISLSKRDSASLMPPPGALRPAVIQKDRNGNFVVAIMPVNAASGVYNVWIKNKEGWSIPQKMNAARPLFISEREAFTGLSIRVSGRNFDCSEFGVAKSGSHTKARLNDGSKSIYQTVVTRANPYCLTLKIGDAPPGKYFVEVSNDNGGNWSRLDNGQQITLIPKPPGVVSDYDPLGMGVAWASHFNWKNIQRVHAANKDNDISPAVQLLIDKVAAQGGGIVYFPAGIYKISKLQLQKNVVLMGESKTATILSYCGREKDFITCAGSAIAEGHVGIANMRIEVPPSVKERPDVFINLGQAAIWQGVSNIHQRTAAEMFVCNVSIAYDFTETLKEQRGLPVSSIGNERLYIAGCDFKGFRMESHNYVSDYITVRNNRFEYAQGVFIYTGNYLFLENNRITGHREINKEKHGFMLRANAYVYNNTVAHTGSEPDSLNENWNDGEALCNETPGGNHNFGSITGAAASSITAGQTAGPFIVPQEEIYNHRSVMIVHGRGLGQYRRVEKMDTLSKTIRVEKDWYVVPDSTSRFTLLEPNENITYYRNTIIDNPKGIWLFGNSIDCVAAENTSIDSDGIFIFSCMYTNDSNPMYYFVPNYFNRITRNRIKGVSRKSHRAGIGVNCTREGSSNGAYFGVAHYANEFRSNHIIGVVSAKPLAEVTEAPAVSGIFVYATVHSSQYDNRNIAGDATNHIIEDNVLEHLTSGINLSRCVYGQVIRNNQALNSVKVPIIDGDSQLTICQYPPGSR